MPVLEIDFLCKSKLLQRVQLSRISGSSAWYVIRSAEELRVGAQVS